MKYQKNNMKNIVKFVDSLWKILLAPFLDTLSSDEVRVKFELNETLPLHDSTLFCWIISFYGISTNYLKRNIFENNSYNKVAPCKV